VPRISAEQLAARRRQILDGARSCFTRHGYEGATVRRLEQATGLSRGAIFHHFGDKEALFLALAEHDAQRMADVVAAHGLVQVMRELLTAPHDQGWSGTFLEVARRRRTDPAFNRQWATHSAALTAATRSRLTRQVGVGVVRADVPVDVLAQFLELVLEGLVSSLAICAVQPDRAAPDLAAPEPAAPDLAAVLDLVERCVRRPADPHPGQPGPVPPEGT